MSSRTAKQKRLAPITAPVHAAAAAAAAALSSSSSAAAAPAPAAPLCDVLVLGMAFVSSAFEDRCVVRSETTASPLRDRARLQKLQAEHPHFRLITQNDNQSSEECKGHRHLKGKFDQRSAKELRDTFQSSTAGNPLVFSHIFCDYFRFPGEYMRTAYVPFMRSMLPKLVELGLMDSKTQLVLPNLPTLLHALLPVRFRRPLHNGAGSSEPWGVRGHVPCFLHFAPLAAEDYLLYAVTSRIAPETLGGFQNSQEISQLSKRTPFVTLTLSDNATQSRRSFYDVVDDVAAAVAQAPPIFKVKAKPGRRSKAREVEQEEEEEAASPSVSPSTAISPARMTRQSSSSSSSSSSPSSPASPSSPSSSIAPISAPSSSRAPAGSSASASIASPRSLISAPAVAVAAAAARSRGSKRPAAVSAQAAIAATAAASSHASIDLAKVRVAAAAMDQAKRQRTQH